MDKDNKVYPSWRLFEFVDDKNLLKEYFKIYKKPDY